MANHAVTTYTTTGDFETVMAALETQIETVDSGKTIHQYAAYPIGQTWHGQLVYDT